MSHKSDELKEMVARLVENYTDKQIAKALGDHCEMLAQLAIEDRNKAPTPKRANELYVAYRRRRMRSLFWQLALLYDKRQLAD